MGPFRRGPLRGRSNGGGCSTRGVRLVDASRLHQEFRSRPCTRDGSWVPASSQGWVVLERFASPRGVGLVAFAWEDDEGRMGPFHRRPLGGRSTGDRCSTRGVRLVGARLLPGIASQLPPPGVVLERFASPGRGGWVG